MVATIVATFVLLATASFDVTTAQRKVSRNIQVGADVKTNVNFDCPEEFGYYPHPNDCTQYYVCVFGGALLESCTGGLMYSHELQTCDWPRNVGCDGSEISSEQRVTSGPSPSRGREQRERERERERDEPRQRYSPPPPPPPAQPAAVVTSRGQPRQLHPTQQEIIKQQQQQQLYADADDVLPPAEEIENDRQQRVYRGQPSTIGQVQRDRDGLRHTNALPSYSSRGEKIGVISFGTGNQQHYSDDFLQTNDLTIKRRQKRQINRSHHREGELWHGGQQSNNKNTFRLNPILLQAPPINKQPFKSSNQDDGFQPFVPEYKRNYHPVTQNVQSSQNFNFLPLQNTRSVAKPGGNYQDNYQYFNIGPTKSPPSKNKIFDSNSIRHTVEYNYNQSPRIVLQPAFTTIVERHPIKYVNTTTNFKYLTDAVTSSFKPHDQVLSTTEKYLKEETIQSTTNEEGDEYYDDEDEEDHRYQQSNNTLERPHDDYFKPPPTFYKTENKYANIENPFANPSFNYDKFLDSLRGPSTTTTTVKPKAATQSYKLQNEALLEKVRYSPNSFNSKHSLKDVRTPVPLLDNKLNLTKSKVPVSDYYYYEYEDVGKPKIYSSQIKSHTKPVPKKPYIEYEYYYEEYDYPDSKEDAKNNSTEMKYSARYQDIIGKKLNKTEPISSTLKVKEVVSSTTPKVIYTIRPRIKPQTVKSTTVKAARGQSRLRLTTTHHLTDNDSKHSKSEESSVAPSISTATATARTLYNSSQYSGNHYDPLYPLYDEDVELYRDVDYSHNSAYGNSNEGSGKTPAPTYRGTPAPAIQSTVSHEDVPKNRGNTVYIQNQPQYQPQDIYQQSTVSDYSDDNSYNNQQLDDQSGYRQSGRQPSRTNSRGRGSTHYSASGGTAGNVVNNEVTVTVNRGTPRSRPTLKPSTSIVDRSRASEPVDIYRFPPRRPDPIYPQPQPDKTAAKCRKDVCLLPDCSCGGKEIPGNIPVEETPQMVLITFDDAVSDLNKQYYIDLFENGRTNPNGCPISATFYVSHEWTDYSHVQNLYADGHEMASHTVSHSFGEQFSQKRWTREVAGQREILSAYGGVHLEDVRGMRAPFLSVGGNKMFKMLYDSNFTYDSSMPIYENKPPSWPYTLDYKLFHDCMIPPCPTRSYPGVWEVPMVMWQDLNGGRCSMGDACSNPPDSDGVFKMLTKNFQRHYTTNRAPFGLFYHAAWFTQPHHKEGFIKFIDSILAMKDVWLVTNWQALQWVRDPTPSGRLGNFQPFQCDFSDRPKRCNNPKVCNLWHKSGVRYMRTCQPCPEIYPWTGKTGIQSSKIDNDIED
ncbi:unnamed protein product [Brassicogethes aeneus]|uniref:Chitin-binding type-2 domain-containing protein n=1 Tax=Brassicogethes aeneus TaxID=1431903 RepID=A0A9P0FLG4_BRAAE|nr:unnamed protein product [Brassicogethes aeneus]